LRAARESHRSAKKGAERENGAAREVSRDDGKNNNTVIVRAAGGSDFVAAIEPATVKTFSARSVVDPRFRSFRRDLVQI
jgi:hypothetical protein